MTKLHQCVLGFLLNRLNGIPLHLFQGLDTLVVRLGLHTTLVLQSLREVIVLPTNARCKVTETAILSVRLQAQDLECLRHNHALLPIKWVRDTLVGGHAVKSCSSSCRFVGDHSSYYAPKHFRWSTEVKLTLTRVRVHTLALEFHVLQPIAVEGARNVHVLTTHEGDLLAIENLLRDDGGQSTHHVAPGIDDGFFGEHDLVVWIIIL